jgi:EEF1A lysine methyltransferase 4
MAQYGRTVYWDERYTKDPEPFDWYQRYAGVRDLINQYVKREDVILMAGCGNSRLTEDMFEDGYTTITNIDVSRVVIDQQIDRYKDKPTLQWQQMNITQLDFPDETFDCVVAKATLDAVLCGEGSTANVSKLCSEVSRVLKPNGCFFIGNFFFLLFSFIFFDETVNLYLFSIILIIVSYGVPDNRLNYLEKEDIFSWQVTVHTIPKPTVSAAAVPSAEEANGVHYVYICSKGGVAEEG